MWLLIYRCLCKHYIGADRAGRWQRCERHAWLPALCVWSACVCHQPLWHGWSTSYSLRGRPGERDELMWAADRLSRPTHDCRLNSPPKQISHNLGLVYIWLVMCLWSPQTARISVAVRPPCGGRWLPMHNQRTDRRLAETFAIYHVLPGNRPPTIMLPPRTAPTFTDASSASPVVTDLLGGPPLLSRRLLTGPISSQWL